MHMHIGESPGPGQMGALESDGGRAAAANTILYSILKVYPDWSKKGGAVITLANKGPSSQGYGFSSAHVWM